MAVDNSGVWVIGLLLAWLGFRAGTRHQRSKETWSYWRDLVNKLNIVRWLKWNHLGYAGLAWAVLIVLAFIVINGGLATK